MATQVQGQPFYIGTTLQDTHPKMEGGPEKTWFKETAAQTFGIGDLIYLDTNGTLAICTVTATKLNSAIAGIATKAAVGTTGTNVYFHAIRPDDLFIMNVFHSTVGSAVTAQTQLGSVFGITLQTNWYVDIEHTVEGAGNSLARVQVVDFPLRNPFDSGNASNVAIGDTYGPVIVRFLPFSISSDGASNTRILQLA